MRNNKLTLIRELRILVEAMETGKIRKTARKYGISLFQIRKWRSIYAGMKEQFEKNPKKLILDPGDAFENPELEKTSEYWIKEQRFAELALSTQDIIDKAMWLMLTFKDGNEKNRSTGYLIS